MTAATTADANQALADRVFAFLSTFATPDDLVEECRKRGLKGDRLDPCSCIIARLIESEFSETKDLLIMILPGSGTFQLDDEPVSVLPQAACEFANAFDNGDYPDLDYEDEDEDEDEDESEDDPQA